MVKRGSFWVPVTPKMMKFGFFLWFFGWFLCRIVIQLLLQGQNSNLIIFWGYEYPKWPPFGWKIVLMGQKCFLWAQKRWIMIFYGSFFQNSMFDTKTNLPSIVDPKICPKKWQKKSKLQKMAIFEIFEEFYSLDKGLWPDFFLLILM